ncbi:aldehyde dehydrogenase family protein [Plantactinospora sp. CA-294935]|uniref:aldehyde dehydrogenase family protein n=1 Tax=Plantactinospora sp. CA-294935 TaxID=3240012 RepID=UPI003D8D77DD
MVSIEATDGVPGGADDRVHALVAECGRRARAGSAGLAEAPDSVIDSALTAMADRLVAAESEILAANQRDVEAARAAGMSPALQDRLRLDAARLKGMADQLRLLAEAPFPARETPLRSLPGGLRLSERRRPVGVIGANFEARPNVTVDVASQLVKSRNAGVLRTGSAALASANALHQHVIAPGLRDVGLDPDAIQLLPDASRASAVALVRQTDLIPLVILRGSGDATRSLGAEAARHGVRTLAHADGGGVLYVDAAADLDRATELLVAGLDRLGVCNRVNLLLVHRDVAGAAVPRFEAALTELGVRASLPPYDHPVGYEWALDSGREATVTIAEVADLAEAVTIANTETSGLAATIVTEDRAAAERFIASAVGTGVFWNASTRLLDGFKLHGVPETGINVDHVPGPRGPVTFQDLYLRQYVVVPEDAPGVPG